MSEINVNKIAPSTGTNVTLGDSSDTFKVPSGVTLDVESGATLDVTGATVSGLTSTTINNNADDKIITGSGTANTLEAENNFRFDGSNLTVGLTTPDTSSYFSNIIHIAGSSNAGIMFNRTDSTAAKWSVGCNSAANLDFVKEGAVKMRITTGGNVGIADTAPAAALEVSPTSSEGVIYATGNSQSNELIRWNNTNSTSTNHNISFFKRNGTTTGSISQTNNSTAFNTSSDYRIKENEVAISDGITRLKTLKPYRFNFKTDADKTVDGFFAHEVSSVVPEAINGEKDAIETYTDDNGDEQTRINPQGIDQSKLVPLLTSALQEAITKIETLEAKVAALENA